MAEITMTPATAREWNDLQAALTGGGDGRTCQCAWVMMRSAEYRAASVDARREALRRETEAPLPPGILAYRDGEPAGWVRVGPRTAHLRFERTRVAAASPEPKDDPSVWVVSCFSIRSEHRRRGVSAALLDAAVAFAREHGARVIEGYPLDNTQQKPSSNALFVGALTTFLDAGFTELARPTETRRLVSLTL
ncbi:GNAT family N-acetyltransferase [Microbacterium halophytorum]|uniref:GNAT family N-acetyltransferase n=1 Tax=Microbacterium halophytorum TaxID=2067568 RepID=UPI000CFA8B8F|nr:GNAT family N-acetyltransferase [Microbacterium halophytorum]